jgi:hypothetical protein
MPDNGFEGLKSRVKHRFIRSIDIASILVFDAIILLLGYVLIRIVHFVAVDGGELFHTATVISQWVFLLLFLAYVGWDLYEFAKQH